ncbi:MAG: insulinase family protein [Verrucomicrobiae bacterium]|nr:insulinase family protein [Verrucomicrobiae bacterium]
MATRYQLARLDNRLQVATAVLPAMQSVTAGVWIAVGGRHEPARLCGISHFIEHLLFKGTRRRTAKQISQEVEGVGGYLNAFTSEEHTCYFAKASADKLGLLLDVLLDIYTEPLFAPADLAKEREVIKEEIQMYLDRPDQHVHELLNELLWPAQPLGRPLTGTLKSMDAISRRDVLAYKARHYVSDNTLIAVAGPVEHAAVTAMAARAASRIRPGRRGRFSPARESRRGPLLRLHAKDTEQTHVALAVHTFSRYDPRRYALKLLNVILGENMSSRLFQAVREQHGLAYAISSATSYFADSGALVISAGLDNAHLRKALRVISRELSRLAAKPPSAAELRRAKDFAIGQMRLSLESTSNQMMWVGEHLIGYGEVLDPDEIVSRLQVVSPDEIQALARSLLRTPRLRLAVIGPQNDAKAIERELVVE